MLLEEPISSLLHVGGALAFLALAPRLVREARGAARVAVIVFVVVVQFQLWASAVYHALPFGPARGIAQRLDHAGIFLLIAGTFTPCHVILFRGFFMRWGVLGLVWSSALVSLVGKTVFFDELPESQGLVIYLAIGWIGLVSGVAALRLYGMRFVLPILWGGLAYTCGAVLDLARWPDLWPGSAHDVFHVAVLLGVGLHWAFIGRIASRPLSLATPA